MKNTRRRLWIAWLLVAIIAAACAPAASSTPAPTSPPQIIQQTVQVPVTQQVTQMVTQIVPQQVVVTATPGPAATAEPVTLTYLTFSAAPDHLKDLDSVIKAFEALHPNITVNVETAPFADYFTKLQTEIAGGTAPDIFELNYENFVTYAAKGVLLDLSTQSKNDPNFQANIFYSRAYQAFNLNGLQLGLPASYSTVVLFYNKALFDKAKVAYPTATWTWADAVAAAQKMTDPAAGVWGLYSPIQYWEFYKKAAQNNCQFFSADKKTVNVDSPDCVAALQTMVDFVNKDKVMPSDADMGGVADGDLFKAGKIAMDVTGIWMFSAFKDAPFQWDIQIEPGLKQQATQFFANGVSVFAATKHPLEAWEWAQYFTTSKVVADVRVKSGWDLPALSDQSFFADYLNQTPPANRKAVFDSLNFAIVPPVIERQGEMQDDVNKLLDQVKLGQLTPQQALTQAKTQIEGLMK